MQAPHNPWMVGRFQHYWRAPSNMKCPALFGGRGTFGV